MEILRFFESIRTPFLDAFFLLVTRLGEETIFIIIGFFLFWCVSKKDGYYILSVGFVGIVFNQFMKLIFRVPRPWVLDKSFTIVKNAEEMATGYSFPSGHTQSSVGTFGGISRIVRSTSKKVLLWIICVLIPLSRIYLGVHTLLDVGVSFLFALILIFTLRPIVNKAYKSFLGMNILFFSLSALGVLYLLFTEIFPFPENIDMANYLSGVSTAYKLVGCILALWLSYVVDEKYIHFDTGATPTIQALKMALGIASVFSVKLLMEFLAGETHIAEGIVYFVMTFFACGVWPLTFKYLEKIKKD